MDIDRDYHKSCVLIVDDDPLNVEVLSEILTEEGYDNVTATTEPEKAIDLFEKSNFDLILLDILMPVMDGFTVMEQFKQIKKEHEIPILILSALSDHRTRLRALGLGARDYLTKPFNADEVLVRIRNLLEVKLAREQLQQHNAILDHKVKERTQELKETQLEIVNRLGAAAEYRDNETGLHIIRMSKFSYEIARGLGIDTNESELILNASPMHDIGKIGIPDSILLKPGKLSSEEWEVMKTHTTIGAKILKGHPSTLLQTAITIAMTHHERWDGAGYPRQLKGEDIPLAGRIVAVADVFDALTSVRPYKKSWTVEDAVTAIEDDAGKHFDPSVVEAFIKRLPQVLQIKKQHVDYFPDKPSSVLELSTNI